MIKVSIIITNYNYSRYLNRSIRSAFIQNYPVEQYEVIVVDDSSTDWSREIIESYGHLITPVFLPTNTGLSAARNRGIVIAQGEYILFLDADDYLNRHIIFVESLYLDLNPDWGAVACDYFHIDDREQVIGRKSCKENPIACGIMFRKTNLVHVGMFDEGFEMWEEKDLRLRFEDKFIIKHIELPLYRYRKHDNNLTNNRKKSSRFLNKLNAKHNSQYSAVDFFER